MEHRNWLAVPKSLEATHRKLVAGSSIDTSIGAVLASKTKAEPTSRPIRNVHEAIEIVLSDRASYPKSLNYAVGYLREGLYMPLHSEALRVQCLYILNNIIGWRHPQAKEVRAVLKAGSK